MGALQYRSSYAHIKKAQAPGRGEKFGWLVSPLAPMAKRESRATPETPERQSGCEKMADSMSCRRHKQNFSPPPGGMRMLLPRAHVASEGLPGEANSDGFKAQILLET